MTAELEETVTAALNAATPGPWHHSDSHGSCVVTEDRQTMVADLDPDSTACGWRGRREDAHLIANAPTWLAALAAENRQLGVRNQELTDVFIRQCEEAAERELRRARGSVTGSEFWQASVRESLWQQLLMQWARELVTTEHMKFALPLLYEWSDDVDEFRDVLAAALG